MIDVLVCSTGGCGSTMLIKALQAAGVDTNAHDNSDGLKHSAYPPPANTCQRAIYVWAPRDEVIRYHRRKSAECPEWWASHSRSIGGDGETMPVATQIRNWLESQTVYPLLTVKYQYLWDRQHDIQKFVGRKISLPRFQPGAWRAGK